MKKFLIIIAIIFSFLSLQAQRNEIGLLVGTTYYLGDLNPSKQFFLTKPAGGLLYRYIFNSRWALKLDGIYGNVEGDDAKSKTNEKRNLSFKSPIFEFSSQLELNFLPYVTGNKKRDYFTPYIFGGIGVFSYKPRANYNGTWYNLQPLGTEGQGTSAGGRQYSLVKVAFPFGLGVKYSVGNSICVGLEWGLRKTTTDYLDDVSTTYADPLVLSENGPMAQYLADRSSSPNEAGVQRGNAKTKDWYSFAGIFITIKFKALKDEKCPAYGKRTFKEFFRKD
jgi:opacity protein-like surface antigen